MYICDSEKTLFINIVLWYIAEAGNRYILSLSSFSTFFSSFFFSPLYRIKWWIFACPCRLFQKHSADGFEAAASALVLGYYYFLVFLAFVAPKKKRKIIHRINNNAGKWALALTVCSVVCVFIYTHLILSLHLLTRRNVKKKMYKNWNCYISTISGYYFYNTNFSSSSSFSSSFSRVLLFFMNFFLLLRHNMHENLTWWVSLISALKKFIVEF